MTQRSSSDRDSARHGLVRIAGQRPALTAAQRKFNQLVEKIEAQRRQLAEWRAYSSEYHQQLGERFQPALKRLRKKQTSLALLLDRFLEGTALDKRERAKTRQMLLGLLAQMLVHNQEPLLVQLHDKHAPRSFRDEQQDAQQHVRALASEELGVELDTIPQDVSLDELAEWIDDQVDERTSAEAPPPRRKSAKSLAREAERAEGGTRAVRELFRTLASALHPDREADPVEQARKTALMQQVNQAYKAGNLLALLELQLQVEQIDLADLAALADERLRHYIVVLEEQSQRLREELTDFVEPFAATLGHARPERLSPATVRRALQTDIRELEVMARDVQLDLELFKDLYAFKECLRGYRLDPGTDVHEEAGTSSRRRRRR